MPAANSGYAVNAQAPPATYATTSSQNYPAYTSQDHQAYTMPSTSQDPYTGQYSVQDYYPAPGMAPGGVVNSGSYGHYASYPAGANTGATPYPVGTTTNTGAIADNVDWFVNGGGYY